MRKFLLSISTIVGFAFYVIFFSRNNTLTYTNTTSDTIEPKSAQKSATVSAPAGMYKDGSYVSESVDAYYGYIKVRAIVSGGKLMNVVFLDHPQDRDTSVRINNYAMPILKSEALKAQSSSVNIVSGATDSSMAFRQALAQTLAEAKI